MLTRVVAKQAKTKKVKNKFVNGGRGEVQFRRKKLGGKVHAKSSNFQICQEKHQHFHAHRQLVTKKDIGIKN